jgi:glycosyltransferase involved in cell wall biosynthesis
MSALRYVLISVVRDEEAYIEETLRSVLSQSVLPAAWLLRDDGSLDRTPELVLAAAKDNPWIRVSRVERRTDRDSGSATSRGFNSLLPEARSLNPDVVAMLDGDVRFESEYFERLLAALQTEPRLGVVGGRALEPHRDGSWGLVRIPGYHVHGATKVYRLACLDDIGPLHLGPGWDTVDIIRARLSGWTTRSLPDVRFRHLRVTGRASGRLPNLRVKGRAAYEIGYLPLFAMIRSVRNMVRSPYVVGGLAFLFGYIDAWMRRRPHILSPGEVAAFRREQMRALLGRRSWWRG